MNVYKNNNNYMRDKKNRHRNLTTIGEQSLKTDYKNKVRYEENYGKHYNLLLEGENDRINGKPSKKIEDTSMQTSYNYGYYERASRVLVGKFTQEVFPPEKQREIGMNDVNNNIPQQYIIKLKEFTFYLEGMSYQMGVNSYDFVTMYNISIEEYFKTMKIICPEIIEEAFIEGYYSIEQKTNKKSK